LQLARIMEYGLNAPDFVVSWFDVDWSRPFCGHKSGQM